MKKNSGPLKGAFIGKDGALLEYAPANIDPAGIQFVPGAANALKKLKKAGFLLFIVTHQPGVARGVIPERAIVTISTALQKKLSARGVDIDGFYYCPHDPSGVVSEYRKDCRCRKPRPGLLHLAAEHHKLDLKKSWFIGDLLDDVEAGRRAGCRTVMIDTGQEKEWVYSSSRVPNRIVSSLPESVEAVLKSPAN